MRIPFPERINLSHALIFATALSCVQIFQGTNPLFSGCVFCFVLITAVAFNTAGGFPYPSGAFIGLNAFIVLLLPMVSKVILGEPGDSNLHAPLRTVEVYMIGMVDMLAAAILSRQYRPRRAFISDMLPVDRLRAAYIGSAIFSVGVTSYLALFGSAGSGTFSSFLVQANRFPILTFVLGTIYVIRRSNGTRSMTWPLMTMMLVSSLGGLLTFSKEQFLSPFFAWAVTAALMRYRLRWVNIIAFGVGIYLVVAFMFPYAQYGRNFDAPSTSSIEVMTYLLTHMDEVNEGYARNENVVGVVHSYNHRYGLLDRLDILSVDDAIIDVTDREGTFGFTPTIAAIENFVPHFLWPDKPPVYFGNLYAHQIGILSNDDFTTGISFSPSSDAYHEGRMIGLLLVEPLIFCLSFLVLDCVIGDVRLNPVGLLTTIAITRLAPEGLLAGALVLMGQLMFTNVLAALVCAYVLPVIGSAFNTANPSSFTTQPPLKPILSE